MNHTQHTDDRKAIKPNGFTGIIASNSNVTIDKSFQKKGTSMLNAFDNSNVVLKDCATPEGKVANADEIMHTRLQVLNNEKNEKLLPMWVHYVLKKYSHDTVKKYQNINWTNNTLIKPINYDINDVDFDLSDPENPYTKVSKFRTAIFNVQNDQTSYVDDIKYVQSDYSLENKIAAESTFSTDDIAYTAVGYYMLFGAESSIRAVWPMNSELSSAQDNPEINLHLYDRIVFPMKNATNTLRIKHFDEVYKTDDSGNKIPVPGTTKIMYSPRTNKYIAESQRYQPKYSNSLGEYDKVYIANVNAGSFAPTEAFLKLEWHFDEIGNKSGLYFMGPYDNDNTVVAYSYEYSGTTVIKNDIEPLNFYFKNPQSNEIYNLFDVVNGNIVVDEYLKNRFNNRLMYKNAYVTDLDSLDAKYEHNDGFKYRLYAWKSNVKDYIEGNHNEEKYRLGFIDPTVTLQERTDTKNAILINNANGDKLTIAKSLNNDNIDITSDTINKNFHFYMKANDSDDEGISDDTFIYLKTRTDSTDVSADRPFIVKMNDEYAQYDDGEPKIDWKKYADYMLKEENTNFERTQSFKLSCDLAVNLISAQYSIPSSVDITFNCKYPSDKIHIVRKNDDKCSVHANDITVTFPSGSLSVNALIKEYYLNIVTQVQNIIAAQTDNKPSNESIIDYTSDLTIENEQRGDIIDPNEKNWTYKNGDAVKPEVKNGKLTYIPPKFFVVKTSLDNDSSTVNQYDTLENSSPISAKLSEIRDDFTSSNAVIELVENGLEYSEDEEVGKYHITNSSLPNDMNRQLASKVKTLVDDITPEERRNIVRKNVSGSGKNDVDKPIYGFAMFPGHQDEISGELKKFKPSGFKSIDLDANASTMIIGDADDTGTIKYAKNVSYAIVRAFRYCCNTLGYRPYIVGNKSLSAATFEDIVHSCVWTASVTNVHKDYYYISNIKFIESNSIVENTEEVATQEVESYTLSFDDEKVRTQFTTSIAITGSNIEDVPRNLLPSAWQTENLNFNDIFDAPSGINWKISKIDSIDNLKITNVVTSSDISVSGYMNIYLDTASIGGTDNNTISTLQNIVNDNIIVNLSGKRLNIYDSNKKYILSSDNVIATDFELGENSDETKKDVIVSISGNFSWVDWSSLTNQQKYYVYDVQPNGIESINHSTEFNEPFEATQTGKITPVRPYDKVTIKYKTTDIPVTVNSVSEMAEKCGFTYETVGASGVNVLHAKFIDTTANSTTYAINSNNICVDLNGPLSSTIKLATEPEAVFNEIEWNDISGLVGNSIVDLDGIIKQELSSSIECFNLNEEDGDYVSRHSSITIGSDNDNDSIISVSALNEKIIDEINSAFTNYSSNDASNLAKEKFSFEELRLNNDEKSKAFNAILGDGAIDRTANVIGCEPIYTDVNGNKMRLSDVSGSFNVRFTIGNVLSPVTSTYYSLEDEKLHDINNLFDAKETAPSFELAITDKEITQTITLKDPDKYEDRILANEAEDVIAILTGLTGLENANNSQHDVNLKDINEDFASMLSSHVWKFKYDKFIDPEYNEDEDDGEEVEESYVIPANDLFKYVSGAIRIKHEDFNDNMHQNFGYVITNAWDWDDANPVNYYYNGYKLTHTNVDPDHTIMLVWNNNSGENDIILDMTLVSESDFTQLYWDKECRRPILADYEPNKGFCLYRINQSGKLIDKNDSYDTLRDYVWKTEKEYEKADFNDWYDAESYVNYSNLNKDTGLSYSLNCNGPSFMTYADNFAYVTDSEKIKQKYSRTVSASTQITVNNPINITSNCSDKVLSAIINADATVASDSNFNTHAANDNISSLFINGSTDEYKAFSFNFNIPKNGWDLITQDQYALNPNYLKKLSLTDTDVYSQSNTFISRELSGTQKDIVTFNGNLIIRLDVLANLENKEYPLSTGLPLSSIYDYNMYDYPFVAILRKYSENGNTRYAFTLTTENDTLTFYTILDHVDAYYVSDVKLANVILPARLADDKFNVSITDLTVHVKYNSDNNLLSLSILEKNDKCFYKFNESPQEFNLTDEINYDKLVRNPGTYGLMSYATDGNFFHNVFNAKAWNMIQSYIKMCESALSATVEGPDTNIYNTYATKLKNEFNVLTRLEKSTDPNSGYTTYKLTYNTEANKPDNERFDYAGNLKDYHENDIIDYTESRNADISGYIYYYSNLIDGIVDNKILKVPMMQITPGEFLFTSTTSSEIVYDMLRNLYINGTVSCDLSSINTIDNPSFSGIVLDDERFKMPYDATIPLFMYHGISGSNFNSFADNDELFMVNAKKMYQQIEKDEVKPNDGTLDLDIGEFANTEMVLTAMIDLTTGENPFKELYPYVNKNIRYKVLSEDDDVNALLSGYRQVRYTNFKAKMQQYKLYKLVSDVEFKTVEDVVCTYDTPSNLLSSIEDSNNGIKSSCRLGVKFNGLIFQEKIREGILFDDISNVTYDERLFDKTDMNNHFNSSVLTGRLNDENNNSSAFGLEDLTDKEKYRFTEDGVNLNACNAYKISNDTRLALNKSENYIGGSSFFLDIQNATTMRKTVSEWETCTTDTKYGMFDIYSDYNPTTTDAALNRIDCVGTPCFNIKDKKLLYTKTISEQNVVASSYYLAPVMKVATDEKFIYNMKTNTFDSGKVLEEPVLGQHVMNLPGIKSAKLTYFDDYIIAKCTLNASNSTGLIVKDPTSNAVKDKYLPIKFNVNGTECTFYIYLDGLFYDKNAYIEKNSTTIRVSGEYYRVHSVKSSNLTMRKFDGKYRNSGMIYGDVEFYFEKVGTSNNSNETIEIHNIKLPAPTLKSIRVLNPNNAEILEDGSFVNDNNTWQSHITLSEKVPTTIEKNNALLQINNEDFYDLSVKTEDVYFSLDKGSMLGGSVKEKYNNEGELTGLLLTLKVPGFKKFKKSGIRYEMKNPIEVKLDTPELLSSYQSLSTINNVTEIKDYNVNARIGDTVTSGLMQLVYNYIETDKLNLKLKNVGAYTYAYNPIDNDKFQIELLYGKVNDLTKETFYVNQPIDKWYNMTIARECKHLDSKNEKYERKLHLYLTDIDGEKLEDITSTSREVFDVSTANKKILPPEKLKNIVDDDIKAGLFNYDKIGKYKFDPCYRCARTNFVNTDKKLMGSKLGSIADDEKDYGKASRPDLKKLLDKDIIEFSLPNAKITLFAGSTMNSALSGKYFDYNSNTDYGSAFKYYAPRRIISTRKDSDEYFILRKKNENVFVSVPNMKVNGIMWVSTPDLSPNADTSYTDNLIQEFNLVNDYVKTFKNCQNKLPPVKYVNKILNSDYAEMVYRNCRDVAATANAKTVDNLSNSDEKNFTYDETPMTIAYVWDNSKVSRTETINDTLDSSSKLCWNKNFNTEYVSEIGSIYNYQDSESVVNMTMAEIGQHKDRQIVVLPTSTEDPFKFTKLSDETGLISVNTDKIVATAALGYSANGYPRNSVMYYTNSDTIKIDTTQTTYLYIKQTDNTTDCIFGATQEKPVYVDTVSKNICSYSEKYEFIPSIKLSQLSQSSFTENEYYSLLFGTSRQLNDKNILGIIEKNENKETDDLESYLESHNFYKYYTTALTDYTKFNEHDMTITTVLEDWHDIQSNIDFVIVSNLLGQHYETPAEGNIVFNTTDFTVFSNNEDYDNYFWKTMNCFYFNGSLIDLNDSTSLNGFIDNYDENSDNSFIKSSIMSIASKSDVIDIEPSMSIIWRKEEENLTYAKYIEKCKQIDQNMLNKGTYAMFDSMNGINISGVKITIKAKHIINAPTYIKISVLKYVKKENAGAEDTVELRWVNDPNVLDIDFLTNDAYKEEYDFDNIVDKEINKTFISTFDPDDICKHVFGIKFTVKNVVPGQNNNNCCIIDGINVYSSNMLNKYGSAANVEDVFVRKVDANCRNYYNFDVQQYKWHLPSNVQEWKMVQEALSTNIIANVDNSINSTTDTDNIIDKDMYEFLSGTIENFIENQDTLDDDISEKEIGGALATNGFYNFSSMTTMYISTDAGSTAVSNVLSDTYMSSNSIRLTWKYVDYVYIYYSCYTPNARELIQTYFGSSIVNMAKAKLDARVEDINANGAFEGKYAFSGGVAQYKSDEVIENINSNVFTWSSSGTEYSNYKQIYTTTPVYGVAQYTTTETKVGTKVNTHHKGRKPINVSTDVNRSGYSENHILYNVTTSNVISETRNAYSNVLENVKYDSISNWTESFVPVAIKYIIEE